MCSIGLKILWVSIDSEGILQVCGVKNVLWLVVVVFIGILLIFFVLVFMCVVCLIRIVLVFLLIIGLMLVDSRFGLFIFSFFMVLVSMVIILLVMLFCMYSMCVVEQCWLVDWNVEVIMFLMICLGSVEELVIIVFWLLVLVIRVVICVLCVVSVWLIVQVVLVELVNIMLVMCGLWVSVVLMVVLLFGMNCSMFFGMLVLCSRWVVRQLIRLVCLVGLVIIGLLVVSVVLTWLMKIVSGKFYGLMLMNMLWFCRNSWLFLLVGLGSIFGLVNRWCVMVVQQCRKLVVLWILVIVFGSVLLVLCMYNVMNLLWCVLSCLVVYLSMVVWLDIGRLFQCLCVLCVLVSVFFMVVLLVVRYWLMW